MFKVNDYIMYGITGVCKVVGVEEGKNIKNEKKNYYVLSPVYSKNTIIKIPVDNQKISMRKLHSKDEIFALINSMPNEEMLWIDDEKERNEQFKSMLRTGNCDDLIKIVKSIYLNKKEKKLMGKKTYKNDDEIMKSAEKLLNEEFAATLGIEPDEVSSYILSHIWE